MLIYIGPNHQPFGCMRKQMHAAEIGDEHKSSPGHCVLRRAWAKRRYRHKPAVDWRTTHAKYRGDRSERKMIYDCLKRHCNKKIDAHMERDSKLRTETIWYN